MAHIFAEDVGAGAGAEAPADRSALAGPAGWPALGRPPASRWAAALRSHCPFKHASVHWVAVYELPNAVVRVPYRERRAASGEHDDDDDDYEVARALGPLASSFPSRKRQFHFLPPFVRKNRWERGDSNPALERATGDSSSGGGGAPSSPLAARWRGTATGAAAIIHYHSFGRFDLGALGAAAPVLRSLARASEWARAPLGR